MYRILVLFSLLLSAILLLLALAMPLAYMQAKAFNKFSDTKATMWDAMWVELRVFPDKKVK